MVTHISDVIHSELHVFWKILCMCVCACVFLCVLVPFHRASLFPVYIPIKDTIHVNAEGLQLAVHGVCGVSGVALIQGTHTR